jgi:hypothetical protein
LYFVTDKKVVGVFYCVFRKNFIGILGTAEDATLGLIVTGPDVEVL